MCNVQETLLRKEGNYDQCTYEKLHHNFMYDIITHLFRDIKGGYAKPPLQFRHTE